MQPSSYFIKPQTTAQKQYCALAAYFKDGISAKTVADNYGYTLSAFYSLVRDFTRRLEASRDDPFFKTRIIGRKKAENKSRIEHTILSLRGEGLANAQIMRALKSIGHSISPAEVWRILRKNGCKRLPRRTTGSISRIETKLNDKNFLHRYARQHMAL